ncbi:MAG: aminopeptidase P family protein [bacterium]|nr:aminopeptidase P family protein [bacterium]MDD3625519.1 aminopeptidase P family protein [Proteiniphilum sp.]MDD3967181.1 aminopeptidase P family protein [Proteiniphilum sp.]MDD3968779.1 aminopeptidase P family protein [Proteiniphilum sp.]MDD4458491.1 aminopeptidase P family protein [Proteiniphilum sp.]
MKRNEITERVAAMRQFMAERNLDAFIIPSTDAHLSEYPPQHWESRKWISGFTGSAGTAVVTKEKAGIWTDSRYFLQAAEELKETGFDLFKMGQPGCPDMTSWIMEQTGKGGRVGIDGLVYAASDAIALERRLEAKEIRLETSYDPFAVIREDRPVLPTNKVFTLPEEITGESVTDKIARINGKLKEVDADGILIVTLDAVAWTFNLRGNDVAYNPVAVAYAYISEKETVLFIDPEKLTDEITATYLEQGIRITDYNDIFGYVALLPEKSAICITGNKINYKLLQAIPPHCRIVDIPSPVDLMKSVKNETELKGFRNAMVKDGIALVKFHMWLEKAVPTGEVTELTVEEKLREFRSEQDLYVGESFATIAGYAGNGAIIHYHASPESCLQIEPEGLLLIDSGAQFRDGTTDITRTIAVGKLTKQMKRDYTNVLKGHIALATVIFPAGTRGSQLDILARKALWEEKLTYWHGTGHGIGHFLNVHEGPQNIRLEENPTTLLPGMVTSNEPGLYRAGKYGIRTENLIVTQEFAKTEEFGTFLNFETITLCPIDTRPIVRKMLTKRERKWLNRYHRMVYDTLKEHLSKEEKAWLKNRTSAI